jgi:hypothetical protein
MVFLLRPPTEFERRQLVLEHIAVTGLLERDAGDGGTAIALLVPRSGTPYVVPLDSAVAVLRR